MKSSYSVNKTGSGFTLIELLVVIAIISILAAILFPVFARARENARKASCQSNLKQLGIAIQMYAQDFDEYIAAPRSGYSELKPEGNVSVRWFGAWRGSIFYEQYGYYYPYMKNTTVAGCATLDMDENRTQYGPVDYAMSEYMYRAKLSQFQNTSQTVLIFDSARIQGGVLDRVPWGYSPASGLGAVVPLPGGETAPGNQQPTFHARHNGVGNVLWLDGHVKARKPTFVASPATSAAERIEENIGVIDDDGDQATDELFDTE